MGRRHETEEWGANGVQVEQIKCEEVVRVRWAKGQHTLGMLGPYMHLAASFPCFCRAGIKLQPSQYHVP